MCVKRKQTVTINGVVGFRAIGLYGADRIGTEGEIRVRFNAGRMGSRVNGKGRHH